MTDSLKVLAVIGARSGGKAIPDKNIKPLAGKPLMAWIIDAAKKAKSVSRVLVSTDSEEYAAIARTLGAETPFIRPADLAGRFSTDFEYIKHALDWLKENENYQPDIVLRLMPTLPLQQSEDIDGVIQVLADNPEAHSAFVIAEGRQHPMKGMKIVGSDGGGWLVSYITGKGSDVNPVARQNFERSYFRANVIATRIETIRSLHSLVGEKIKYHLVPQWHGVDIDSPLDFVIAEKIMEYLAAHPEDTSLHQLL